MPSANKPTQLLTTKEAARFLAVSPAFLERDRWKGPSIPFVRIGEHRVRYKLSALEAYIDRRQSVRSKGKVRLSKTFRKRTP